MDIRKKLVRFLPFLFFTGVFIFIFTALIGNPDLLLAKNNDLSGYVWPIYNDFKYNFYKFGVFSLWQNKFLSGYPNIGHPQTLLMYPFNYLSLLFDLKYYFIIYIFVHLLIAFYGVFALTRIISKIDILSSILASSLYTFSPKMISHLDAGHYSLVAAYAYIPFVLYLFWNLIKKPAVKTAIMLGIFMAFIFILYITVFYYLVLLLLGIFIYSYRVNKKISRQFFYLLFLTGLFFTGITLPQLLASFELWPQLARNLLTIEDVAGPVLAWRQHAFSVFNFQSVFVNQTESVLYLGIIPSILAFLGFFRIRKSNKILIILLFLTCFLFVAGQKTPFYIFLYKYLPGISLFRVPSRIWVIVNLAMSILAAVGLSVLVKKKMIITVCLLFILGIGEFCILGRLKINYPDSYNRKYVRFELPEDLLSEKEYFRFYCTQNCIEYSQVRNLYSGYANGYDPIQMANYFWFIQKAAGYEFASYSLSVPPYQTLVLKPQPNAIKMGILGVKYLVTPYKLTDSNFNLITQDNELYFYQNMLSKPRLYIKNSSKIIKLTPVMDIPGRVEASLDHNEGMLILNDIYAAGWKVYKDGVPEKAVSVDNIIIGTTINKENRKVVFQYLPFGMPYSFILMCVFYITGILLIIKKV